MGFLDVKPCLNRMKYIWISLNVFPQVFAGIRNVVQLGQFRLVSVSLMRLELVKIINNMLVLPGIAIWIITRSNQKLTKFSCIQDRRWEAHVCTGLQSTIIISSQHFSSQFVRLQIFYSFFRFFLKHLRNS